MAILLVVTEEGIEDPPASMELHRAARHAVPDVSDFRTQMEEGLVRVTFRNEADRRSFEKGVSTWISIGRARQMASTKPDLKWIAILSVDELIRRGVEIGTTGGKHRDLFGDDRSAMVASILRVEPVLPNESTGEAAE